MVIDNKLVKHSITVGNVAISKETVKIYDWQYHMV
jgi:hypothetical protein